MDAKQLIQMLHLEAHVEGGFYRRTFEASHREKIDTTRGERFTLSSIFYLLTADSPTGHWHLNQSDIVHYFHLGDPISYQLIHPDGQLENVIMGPELDKDHKLQLTVHGGTWKASHLAAGDYGLISEAVAPGFDFADMTLGDTDELLEAFPEHEPVIRAFSRARN